MGGPWLAGRTDRQTPPQDERQLLPGRAPAKHLPCPPAPPASTPQFSSLPPFLIPRSTVRGVDDSPPGRKPLCTFSMREGCPTSPSSYRNALLRILLTRPAVGAAPGAGRRERLCMWPPAPIPSAVPCYSVVWSPVWICVCLGRARVVCVSGGGAPRQA